MTDEPLHIDIQGETTYPPVGLPNKQKWLDRAELTDAWRIVPRILLFGYASWTIYIVDMIWQWYSHVPFRERANADAILVGSVITAVTSLFTAAVKFYVDSGRNWTRDGH